MEIAEAKRQELTDRLVERLGSAPQISTGDAMQVSLDAMAETLAWFRDDVLPVVGVIDETGRATPMLESMMRQAAELRDTARQAGALGVEAKRLELEVAQVAIAVRALEATLGDLGVDASQAKPLFAKHVRAIAAGEAV